jgi:hypothetical protein
MAALRQKRSIRNGRLGEIKGQDSFKLWSSARNRATRSVGWRRNCHAYAAIGVTGISRKSAAPALEGEASQFGDNFTNDRITIYGSSRQATRLERVSDRQHLQGEHVRRIPRINRPPAVGAYWIKAKDYPALLQLSTMATRCHRAGKNG